MNQLFINEKINLFYIFLFYAGQWEPERSDHHGGGEGGGHHQGRRHARGERGPGVQAQNARIEEMRWAGSD